MDIEKYFSHPVLQAMACSFKYFNKTEISDIARLVRYKGNVEDETRQWVKDKIVIKYETLSYTSTIYKYGINSDYWVNILRTIGDTDIQNIKKIGSKNDHNFTTAFSLTYPVWKCIKGKPFAEDLRKVSWYLINYDCEYAWIFIFSALMLPECSGLATWLPQDLLRKIFNRYLLLYWEDLNFIPDKKTVAKEFYNNNNLPEQDRDRMRGMYLYNNEFIQTGNINEIMEKLDGNPYQAYFVALKLMHNKEYGEAFKTYQAILKELGQKVFDDSLSNFLYALSIMLFNTPKSKKSAGSLMKILSARDLPQCNAMYVVLKQYLYDSGEYARESYKFSNPKDKMLAALFLNHFCDVTPKNQIIASALQLLPDCNSDYMKLLFSFEFDHLKKTSDELCQKTGINTSFFPEYQKIEKWEKILDSILENNTLALTKPTASSERLVYFVDTKREIITVKLQKSKDGGISWSKGRVVTLSSLANNEYECMDDFDRKVAAALEVRGFGWRSEYLMVYEDTIAALVGCQRVYDEMTEQKIDVIEEPLQITVNQGRDDYHISTNAAFTDGSYDKITVTRTGDRQFTVVRANDQQIEILGNFKTIGTFPAKSKEKLTRTLEKLSGSFTVMSPLLKNSTTLKRVDSSPLIAVQISPVNNSNDYSISLAVKPFGTCPPYQKPGRGMSIVSTTIDGEKVQTERDLNAEKKNYQKICKAINGSSDGDDQWTIDTEQCLQLLEIVRTMPETAFVEWPQGVKLRVVKPMIEAKMLNIKISGAGQWFELEGELKIGEKEKIKMAQLLESLRNAEGNFIRLEGDEYIAVSEQLRRQLQAISQMTVGKGKDLKIAAINGIQLSALEEMGAKVKADGQFNDLIARIRESEKKDFPIPTNIHAELRPYQIDGYKWMSRLAY